MHYEHKKGLLGTYVNKDLLDEYTFAHALSGYLMGRLGFGMGFVVLTGLAWDWVIERQLKDAYPNLFFHPSQDEPEHILVDFSVFMGGAILGKHQNGNGRAQ
jgi:hypothetical protein